MSLRARQLAQAASIVMFFFVLSRILGLVREIVISHQFGTSRELDAYLAAFRIPDLLFNLVAGGALASAFIPPFAAMLAEGQIPRSWQLATRVINLVFVVTTSLCLAAAIFALPLVSATVAVGFTPAEQELTANLMRIMLVTPILFGISGIVMGILNARQEFALPAAAPAVYNLGIIGGAILLAPTLGVYGLALGVVAGSLLHLLIQVPYLFRVRMKYSLELGIHDTAVHQVVRLMIPRTIGIAAVQLNFLVNTILASTLAPGSLAALNYAFLLILLPEGIIAQSIGIVLFPTFSRLSALSERDALRRAFSTGLRVVWFLTIPASVGLILLRTPIIQLLFQHGAFNAESTAQTALALQFFALGLFAHAGLEIITRAFYALQDTATPVRIAIVSVVLNIILSLIFLQPLAQGGLALANSIATILEMVILLRLLSPRLGGLGGRQLWIETGKTVIGSVVMGAAIIIVINNLSNLNALLVTVAAILAGAATFLFVEALLRSDEIRLALRMARRQEI